MANYIGDETMSMLELIPAYGRVYKDTSAMEQDWKAGKDFKIRSGGPYCSIRDSELMREEGYTVVRLYPNMLHEHFITKTL